MKRKILNVVSILTLVGMIGFVAPVRAASNGCDNDANDFINPVIALCSTHVYNIGHSTNPTTAATRQDMDMVVALKTTIITQQMYRQYENLEAIVKRLKTQLEKAVLTSKLQMVAGTNATSTTGGEATSNSGSLGRNIYVEDAANCDRENTTLDILKCIQDNISKAEDAAAKNPSGATKQLEGDLQIAETAGLVQKNDLKTVCSNMRNNQQKIAKCASDFRIKLTTKRTEIELQNAKQRTQ